MKNIYRIGYGLAHLLAGVIMIATLGFAHPRFISTYRQWYSRKMRRHDRRVEAAERLTVYTLEG